MLARPRAKRQIITIAKIVFFLVVETFSFHLFDLIKIAVPWCWDKEFQEK